MRSIAVVLIVAVVSSPSDCWALSLDAVEPQFIGDPGGAPINHDTTSAVTAFVSGRSHAGKDGVFTIDGGGLTAQGTHTYLSVDNVNWLSDLDKTTTDPEGDLSFRGSPARRGYIAFEFDQPYWLTGTRIWNYNAICCLNRGLREVDIFYTNMVNPSVESDWLSAGSIELGLAWGNNSYTGEVIDALNGVPARYVVLAVRSNFGGTNGIGLSEIRFLVPEPSSLGMLSMSSSMRVKPCRGLRRCRTRHIKATVLGRGLAFIIIRRPRDPAPR